MHQQFIINNCNENPVPVSVRNDLNMYSEKNFWVQYQHSSVKRFSGYGNGTGPVYGIFCD
jgi:hypothetical protein